MKELKSITKKQFGEIFTTLIVGILCLRLVTCVGRDEVDQSSSTAKNSIVSLDVTKPLFTKYPAKLCDSREDYDAFTSALISGHAGAEFGATGCYDAPSGIPVIMIDYSIFHPSHIRIISTDMTQTDAWTSVDMLTNTKSSPTEDSDSRAGIDKTQPLYLQEKTVFCKTKKSYSEYENGVISNKLPKGCVELKSQPKISILDEDNPLASMLVQFMENGKYIEGWVERMDISNEPPAAQKKR